MDRPSVPAPSALYEHRPGVWIKESWLRFSGLVLQTRMVALDTGQGLALYSPSPAKLEGAIADELRSVGEPRWLIAPNEIHNVGLRAFQKEFPDAHTTGCVGHPRRVNDVRFDVLLDGNSTQEDVPWTEGGNLRFHVIGGNRLLHEIAVLHTPSKTLVLTDAVECIHPDMHLAGPPSRTMTWLMGRMGFQYRTPVMSPEHHALCVDPGALRASLSALMAWDFDSVVMSHGTILEGEAARSAVDRAFGATLDAIENRSLPGRLFWRAVTRFV
jgi:hypothetical protein